MIHFDFEAILVLATLVTGLIWLVSGGLFGIGYAYDFFTLNEQVDEANRRG